MSYYSAKIWRLCTVINFIAATSSEEVRQAATDAACAFLFRGYYAC